MTTQLPPSTDFTGAAVTEGGFKAALTNLRTFMADLLGTDGTPATARAALGVGPSIVETFTNKTALALTNNLEARSGPDASAFCFRNRITNPRAEIYTRAVAATADDTYFADCWYALTQTGTIMPSVLSLPEDGYPVGIRLTQSQASAQRFGFAQIIEARNCRDLRGKNSVLVPRIRISNSQAVRYAILGWTGTADAVTSDVVNDWTSATYTAGNFFLAANLSVIAVGAQTPAANTWTSLTPLTAANGSTFSNLITMIWTEGTAAQNVTLDFDYVQLEAGQTATPFENRDAGDVLRQCKRYLPRTEMSYLLGQAYSTNAAIFGVYFDVEARVPPTGITLGNGATAANYSVSNAGFSPTACNGVTFNAADVTGGAFYGTTATTPLVAGNVSSLSGTGTYPILWTGCEL